MPGLVFSESDWKLFRSRIGIWQEKYMEALCKEYMTILSDDGKGSDRFWKLEERIKEDVNKTGVQARMSRSKMFYNILSLIDEGAITVADLYGFSDDLKDAIKAYTDRNFLRGQE